VSESSTIIVQRCLDRLKAGDTAARDELIRQASARLEMLTRKMMGDYRSLRRWEESGDVLQNAVVRLCRAMQEIVPPTPKDFFRFAALQIRRELIDLARHHYGPQGAAGHHASVGPNDQRSAAGGPLDGADLSNDPAGVAQWSEFHRLVDELPEPEREVFDLLWYQGVTQDEAAVMLGISERTLRYRWRDARLRLAEALGGELPGE
jgi:RNA polymerase sigma-70 factor (ECF subfamily)